MAAPVLDFLAKHPLFSSLRPDELSRMVPWFDIKQVPAGQVLLWEGKPHDAFYILWKGRVVVSKLVKGEVETVLAHLDPPAHFGELNLVDDKGSSATVTAEEDCTVLHLTRDRLRRLLDSDSHLSAHFAWALMRDLTGRLRSTNQKLQEIVLWGLEATGVDPLGE
jgi:CRP-like cAMP-binding protein